MVASSEFDFRQLRLSDDVENLLQLLFLGFPEARGGTQYSEEILGWKFSLDQQDPNSELGALGGHAPTEILVSFYGVIPMEYTISGRRRTLGLVCDVMSHPNVRRRGLFVAAGRSAMARLEDSRIDAVIGFPIRDDVMPGHIKVGWSSHFRMPVYLAATGSLATGSSLLSAGAVVASVAPRALARSWSSIAGDVRFLGTEEFVTSEAVVRLERHELSHGRNLAVRSPAFLRWRLARPGASYVCAVAHSGGGVAYAIARHVVLRGVPALAILDLMSDDPRATRALTGALLRASRDHGSAMMAFCANRATARRLRLGTLGFARSPMTFRLIARPTSGSTDVRVFSDDQAWHMTWLDADTL